MTANERRNEILNILAETKRTTVPELMMDLHASRSTVMRDIDVLSCSYPIETIQGNGGGVRVMEGERIYRRALNRKEESFLLNLLPGLQTEEREIAEGILRAFSKKRT